LQLDQLDLAILKELSNTEILAIDTEILAIEAEELNKSSGLIN
jgi:hypothetical protein